MPSQKDDLNNLVRDNASEKDIMESLEKIAEFELETASDMHYNVLLRNNNVSLRNMAATAIGVTTTRIQHYLEVPRGLIYDPVEAFTMVGLTWGKARIAHEVLHQIINHGSANISGNLTKSMRHLEAFEGAHFDRNSSGIIVLQHLEKKILAEGNKWAPDLNVIRKDLTKSQILRQAILNTHDLTPSQQKELIDKSTAVVESFEAWAKVQKGRYAPILNFVSNVLSSDKKDIPRVSDRSR